MQVLLVRLRALVASVVAVAAIVATMTGATASQTASTAPVPPSPKPATAPVKKPTKAEGQKRAEVKRKRAPRTLKAKKPRRKLTGKKKAGFVWPVHGIITSNFGPRKIFGHVEPHRGMDIACSKRQNIVASKAGRVIFIQRRNPIYGKIAVIKHRNGYSSLYSHMRRMRVDVNMRVRKGETIGKCGATGRATGPHVHFEIRRNGRHMNPRPYLNR